MSQTLTFQHCHFIQKKENKTNTYNEKEWKLCHYELIHILSHKLAQITSGLKTPV